MKLRLSGGFEFALNCMQILNFDDIMKLMSSPNSTLLPEWYGTTVNFTMSWCSMLYKSKCIYDYFKWIYTCLKSINQIIHILSPSISLQQYHYPEEQDSPAIDGAPRLVPVVGTNAGPRKENIQSYVTQSTVTPEEVSGQKGKCQNAGSKGHLRTCFFHYFPSGIILLYEFASKEENSANQCDLYKGES